ncbi:MAG: DUF6869 domain-containing protein [Roseiarcus sp.]
MNWCDEILGLRGEAFSKEGYARAMAVAKSLSIADLRQAWRVVSYTRRPEGTDGTRLFCSYFDGLGENDPDRACDFIQASVADERDEELVALIGDGKMLGQLLLRHGALTQSRLAPAAAASPRLRWLLGSAHSLIRGGLLDQPNVQATMLPLADRVAWDTWLEENRKVVEDFESASLNELAAMWIEANARSPVERSRDDLHRTMFELCRHLASNNRMQGLEFVRRVLAQTDDWWLLGSLAAGLLEDLVCSEDEAVLTRVEADAARDPRFRRLLSGVWYESVSPASAARIDKARGGAVPF